MYNLLRLLDFAQDVNLAAQADALQRLRIACGALPRTQDCIIGRTLGSTARGEIIWRLAFANEDALECARDAASWRNLETGLLGPDGPFVVRELVVYGDRRSGGAAIDKGVYRAALFCANQLPTPERLKRFANETAAMPLHIHTIRRWNLAEPLHVEGTRPWTVVWEQEYNDLEGLQGPYLMHPCHWAHVDRWFDPEYPEWLVDPWLCHVYCEFDRT